MALDKHPRGTPPSARTGAAADEAPSARDEVASAVAGLERRMLAGPRELTMRQLAARADVGEEEVARFWRTLGFPGIDPDEPVFSQADVDAVARHVALRDAGVGAQAADSLTRALGHTSERLVTWQLEALIEGLATELDLDDLSARVLLLDRIAELAPLLEAQLLHSWRRQLVAVAGRLASEFAQAGSPDGPDAAGPDALPLARAVGFADMVSFTRRIAGLGSHELAQFVQRFETLARDVVTAAGGRVVKTIGDAVLFVADDVATGAQVALGLAREVGVERGVPPVRVALSWGRVLSRFGDVFGPPVNIAARLTDIAAPATVLLDEATAALLAADTRFELVPQSERDVRGLGPMTPVLLLAARG